MESKTKTDTSDNAGKKAYSRPTLQKRQKLTEITEGAGLAVVTA